MAEEEGGINDPSIREEAENFEIPKDGSPDDIEEIGESREVENGSTFLLKELAEAEKVSLYIWPENIGSFCNKYGIEPGDLPSIIIEKAHATVRELDEVYPSNHFSENLFFICEAYRALSTSDDLDKPLMELRDELASYTNFRQTILSQIELDDEARVGRELKLRSWIDEVNRRTRQMQVISFGSRKRGFGQGEWKTTVYIDRGDLESKWVLTQEINNEDEERVSFTRKEYLDYLESHPHPMGSAYVHATSSRCLEQVARYRALLSRDRLAEVGGYAYSGERMDLSPRVYVFRGGSGFQYDQTNWFNEYPVHFGLSKDVGELVESYAPDHGISLGTKVPIEYIEAMYVPYENLEEAQKWVEENSLNIKVLLLRDTDWL